MRCLRFDRSREILAFPIASSSAGSPLVSETVQTVRNNQSGRKHSCPILPKSDRKHETDRRGIALFEVGKRGLANAEAIDCQNHSYSVHRLFSRDILAKERLSSAHRKLFHFSSPTLYSSYFHLARACYWRYAMVDLCKCALA